LGNHLLRVRVKRGHWVSIEQPDSRLYTICQRILVQIGADQTLGHHLSSWVEHDACEEPWAGTQSLGEGLLLGCLGKNLAPAKAAQVNSCKATIDRQKWLDISTVDREEAEASGQARSTEGCGQILGHQL
jgi:hypothetical protein